MMNMNILAVVTPLSVYHVCSTMKTFWGGDLTDEEELTLGEFSDLNMENCGCHYVRKHREQG